VADDGEILVRGATVVREYVGADEVPVAVEGGWLSTGDLGRVDEDGHLWITGRSSDRIVTGGVTVDAVEVEDALRSHHAISDACVVGLPDPEWGERVAALVVLSVDALDRDELTAFLRERLTASKLPRVVSVTDELPRNANGKVDRAGVRDAITTS
jgi:O-succinylbenzoic acid--CoA ligase